MVTVIFNMWLCGTIRLPSTNHLIYYLLCPHIPSQPQPHLHKTSLDCSSSSCSQNPHPWLPALSPLQPLLRSVYGPLLHILEPLHLYNHVSLGLNFCIKLRTCNSNVNFLFLLVSCFSCALAGMGCCHHPMLCCPSSQGQLHLWGRERG